WFVRVTVRGERHAKFFSDKTHGGKMAAQEVARAFRDSLVKKLPKDRQEALSRRRRKPKRSGLKGITHVVTRNQADQTYDYWQAAWVGEDGRRHSAKFSIAAHGEKKALDLAKKHLVDLGLPIEPFGKATKL